ncbi:hypothetical protein [Endozoicomonas elysicola]|uniref:Uncharacterized protein n=1 Tax=Endozoicomonas elysicola TaxID=305900 RepID=A0A081KAF7_9GAMM|nr:hypothetical protein [Endozoicomonas elysicola]KEI71133.1 hypothetical protein GV64_10590 [Endozoicomonas elysicola]
MEQVSLLGRVAQSVSQDVGQLDKAVYGSRGVKTNSTVERNLDNLNTTFFTDPLVWTDRLVKPLNWVWSCPPSLGDSCSDNSETETLRPALELVNSESEALEPASELSMCVSDHDSERNDEKMELQKKSLQLEVHMPPKLYSQLQLRAGLSSTKCNSGLELALPTGIPINAQLLIGMFEASLKMIPSLNQYRVGDDNRKDILLRHSVVTAVIINAFEGLLPFNNDYSTLSVYLRK